MTRLIVRLAALSALLSTLGCSEQSKAGGPSGPNATGADPVTAAPGASATPASATPSAAADAGAAQPQAGDFPASTRANLQWKRYAAFEADLASALALPKDKLCLELGRENCVRGVHLAPLGGHDPFKTGLLEPSAEPLATTPTVVERVVLSACGARVALDAPSAKSEIFGGLDLKKPAPLPAAEENRALVSAVVRRLLGRDADEQELSSLSQLALDDQGQPLSGRDFALSACAAVGTSTEFLFF